MLEIFNCTLYMYKPCMDLYYRCQVQACRIAYVHYAYAWTLACYSIIIIMYISLYLAVLNNIIIGLPARCVGVLRFLPVVPLATEA